ncbi:3'-5' DNA helicase, partial [Ascosphaera atra]
HLGTGRKRRGNIVLLFMKGKEEDSHVKAMDNYLNMQKRIASGSEFTFHDDKSPRILPREYQPTVDEREIEIPVENLQGSDFLPEPKKKNTRTKRPPKLFHMPDGVETGFKMASALNGLSTKRGAPKTKTPDSAKRKPRQIEIAEKPSISEVCLTAKQEIELNRSYRNVGGSTPQVVRRVRYDAFPSLQRSERRTDLVGHSNLTRRLIQSLRTMHCMPPDCDAAFRELLHPEDEELINQSWRSRERSQQRPASSEVDIGGVTYDASSLIPAQTQSDYADSLQLSDTQPTVPDLGELSDREKTPQAPERKDDEEGAAIIADSQDSLGLDLDLSD